MAKVLEDPTADGAEITFFFLLALHKISSFLCFCLLPWQYAIPSNVKVSRKKASARSDRLMTSCIVKEIELNAPLMTCPSLVVLLICSPFLVNRENCFVPRFVYTHLSTWAVAGIPDSEPQIHFLHTFRTFRSWCGWEVKHETGVVCKVATLKEIGKEQTSKPHQRNLTSISSLFSLTHTTPST